jgi:hypothetical protein
VPKIPVLTMVNLDNAMLPMLAGGRFVSYITRGVICGLHEWVVGGQGMLYISADDLTAHGAAHLMVLLVPPRLLTEVNDVMISTAFRMLGGAAARASIEQRCDVEKRVHRPDADASPVTEGKMPVEKGLRPECDEACADGVVARMDCDIPCRVLRNEEDHRVEEEGGSSDCLRATF